jgi:ubiquinone/menaquinone biosynthesis C-methylase UbiE
MKKVELFDKQFVQDQYKTTDKIDCRLSLHAKYSENKYGLHKWLFDQIQFTGGNKIAELGCGLGTLWTENLHRIPAATEVFLSDFSIGMIHSCQKALRGLPRFHYLVLDAQKIPIRNESMDAVIANHMVYHLQDKRAALSGMKRILKPKGKLYASTVGKSNMIELSEIIARYNPDWIWWNVSNSFQLEDGFNLLKNWFRNVEIRRYEDALVISEPDDLIAYILSGRGEFLEKDITQIHKFIEREFEKNGGIFRITKDVGTLIAS